MRYIYPILLISILILALGLRVYKLDSVPPSLSWDEAAVGYNSYSIANYGHDEYGKPFPLFFRSFKDDKHPVHIYATAIFTKLLGLNEFSTRFPAALFGVLNVLLLYLLAKQLFNKEIIALLAGLFLAISPYNLHFSHFNHEANFVLFFFLLGLVLFFSSLKKNHFLLILSFLSFLISFLTYHPAKLIAPLVIITLGVLYFKKIITYQKELIASFFIFIVFLAILVSNPQLLGIARINQTTLPKEEIEKTPIYKLTKNESLGKINLIGQQYIGHFMPQYLFITGDKNPRLSSQTGQFYAIESLLLICGFIFLIFKRSKEGTLLLIWALIAPLPSSVVGESPHAARASFMMGSWNLISALGFYFIINLAKKRLLKIVIIIVIISMLAMGLKNYLSYYYGEYATRYAIDWQYGMKQAVEYTKKHPEYTEVYITDIRSQPYIFFLYYLKTPLPEYLNTVLYNNFESRDFSLISGFDKYYFGGMNTVEIKSEPRVLYILSPSEYDGLLYKSTFEVKEIIYYPNETTAFYIIN